MDMLHHREHPRPAMELCHFLFCTIIHYGFSSSHSNQDPSRNINPQLQLASV